MTDEEIKHYLEARKYKISAHNGNMDILNGSSQIINISYDFETGEMTLATPDNIFVFDWILN